MSFFDDASLAFLPSGAAGKDGKAYSIKPTDGTGDFAFSRGSNLAATRVGPTGLIEKGRENLLLQSNTFSDAYWIGTNPPTLTANQQGYDGTNDAWLLTKDIVTNYQGSKAEGLSFGGVNTFSFYAKSGDTDFVMVELAPLGARWFDLRDGSSPTGFGAGFLSYSSVDVGNGWFRYFITTEGGTINAIRIYVMATSGTTTTAGSFYLQDAQLEIGLAATDVISTGATTGKAGLLEDEPRFDYSGGATCPSLLLEPSRTNVITQSEYFGGSDWTKQTGITITDNTTDTLSPEGVYNAAKVVSTDPSRGFYIGGNSLTDALVRTIYLKGAVGGETAILKDPSGFGGTTSITLTTDWQRFEHKTTNTGDTYQGLFVDNISVGTIYAYGAQLEEGSYPTSYIPNHSGGSVTRGADDIDKLTGVGVTGDEFTIFLELDLSDTPLVSNVGTYFQTFDASNNSQQEFRFFTSNGEQVLVPYFRQDGAYSFGNGGNAVRFDGKILFRSDGGGNYAMFFGFNGSSTKEVRTGLTAYTLNKIDFISQPKTNLKQLLIFNEALSDADCTTLTT